MKLNRRQKKSLGTSLWDMSGWLIAIIVIGNAIADIPTFKTVIIAILAIVFAVLGFLILGSLDDDNPSQE